jgi:hypothetical protein
MDLEVVMKFDCGLQMMVENLADQELLILLLKKT